MSKMLIDQSLKELLISEEQKKKEVTKHEWDNGWRQMFIVLKKYKTPATVKPKK